MEILTTIHRIRGVNINGRTLEREAVRAVTFRGHKLLMVYSSTVGDYKFPGGGVERDESHEQALGRELMEECGAALIQVDGAVGSVVEYSLPFEKGYETFKMTSFYYNCTIGDEFVNQSLEGYEKALGFEPVWVELDKAIAVNQKLLALLHPPKWLQREIFVLEYLRSH